MQARKGLGFHGDTAQHGKAVEMAVEMGSRDGESLCRRERTMMTMRRTLTGDMRGISGRGAIIRYEIRLPSVYASPLQE